MSFFSKEPFYIGIETTTSSMRIAALERVKGSWHLLFLKELPLKEAFNSLLSLKNKALITTVVSQRQILLRTLELDLKKESDVKAALHFQIEPHLPFSLEEAIMETLIEKSASTNGFTATVFALKESFLKKHLETLSSYQIEPDAVTSPALALAALMKLEEKEGGQSKFLINIGEEESTIVLVNKDKIIDQRSFLTEKEGTIGIERALLSLEGTQATKHTLLLFGKESHLLAQRIQETTGKSVHIMNPPIASISTEEMATFAIAIGAALSQATSKAINFRQKNYQSPHPYKLIKKPLVLSLLLTLLSVGMFFGGGHYYLKAKEALCHQKLSSLLAFRGDESFPLSNLNHSSDYKEALSTCKSHILSEEQSYALEPNIPQVSEVLHWLSEEISHSKPPLQGLIIESLDYELVSRPTPLLKKERYEVQIEITFSANSPNVKEAFEEFLRNATFIVNTNKTIELSFFGGKGRASFTLKDKTRYG